ncbi:outer membrane biosynthesis protein TonB [Rhizobium sp. BK181]|uniref:cell envelope integrity protein TolA n=1 Tax=Rhizobium sp. BK181 TaxID=2587072 RepID=UPI00160D5F29|nr:cell envelope integrity protein TolA [Rhizobium sp. BK181]MBB3317098.1 outer membrane biosynthesis protein TonB [Rhizobium sp. BK181]
MKASIVTSAALHCALLAWALISIGSPEQFKVEDFEAMPVDLVPVEEMTQMQQGDKTAKPSEKPAPKPTAKPTNVENAENMGENKVDLKTPPVPNAKPSNNESAAAPKAVEKPLPQNDPVPNDVKEIMKEETDVEPKQVASITPPKPEITPPTPPKPEETPQEQPEPPKPDAEALPDKVPTPVVKPQAKPPEQKPAEKPPEKKTEDQAKADEKPTDKKKADKKQEKAKSASSKQSDFNADDIAALLNKQDPSNGGAKSSTEVASLGAKKATGGSKLSMSEMDALRSAIAGNWSVIPGMEGASDVRIKVHMKLDPDGNIIGSPEVEAVGGTNEATRMALASGAKRAVMKSSPFTTLPKDKYDAWGEVIVNFDPSDLAL